MRFKSHLIVCIFSALIAAPFALAAGPVSGRADTPSTKGVPAVQGSVAAVKALSFMSQPGFGSCYVGNTGVADAIGRYCATGYPVIYQGYIVDDSCYYQLQDAYTAMQSLRVCQLPAPYRYGNCELMAPNSPDVLGRYCDKTYGINYNGYIVDDTCNYQIDEAVTRMEQTQACVQSGYTRMCRLANPNEPDFRGQYCDKTYGIMYNNQIVNDTCYYNIDTALQLMQSYSFCY